MEGAINWKDVFYYDETSPSCLRWACNIPYKGTYGDSVTYKRVIGDVAGTFSRRDNRWKIKYQQKGGMAHRVVYELFYGTLADGLVIDHIDGDPSNNVISNLRAVTQSVNARNAKRRKSNITGTTGVAECDVVSKYGILYRYYVAQTTEDGKTYNKHFSRNKLGDEEAFRLACEYRERKIAELNAQGAGYTEDHGKR